MDNLINIKCLDKTHILSNLKERYENDHIYTKIDNILIAINPYKSVPHILRQPHPNDVANHMLRSRNNMSVLISGESGAGKTETTKILLNKLLLNGNENDKLDQTNKILTDETHSELANSILQSNIILECFGNASTIRNHNSSRFGKLITLIYNEGRISGAKITTYLLEKIRITNKDISEKNFHIFYLLLDKKYHRTRFLNTENKTPHFFEGSDTYDKLLSALDKFHLTEFIDDIRNILKIIILLEEYESHLEELSKLFNISLERFEDLLKKQEIKIGNEVILRDLTEEQVKLKITTLCQELYNKLFEFILSKINETIQPSSPYMEDNNDQSNLKHINILDIFGFEILRTNSIEQLCINYTNEILQNEFNKFFFTKEQELYISEGLPYDLVDFENNDKIIHFLEKDLFSKINEITKFIRPKDHMIIDHYFKNQNKYIEISKIDNARCIFNINHYASQVKYCGHDFIEKNNLNLTKDIISIFNLSENCLIKEFDVKQSKNLLLNNFYNQINNLKDVIHKTDINFIKCIKPNDIARPNQLDVDKVGTQLVYNGIIEAVAIVRQGYPIRYVNEEFEKLFNIIPLEERKDIVKGKTLTFLKTEQEQFLQYRKKELMFIYATIISKNIKCYLHKKLYKLKKTRTIQIQKIIRGFIQKRRYIKLLNAIKIQSIYRMFYSKRILNKLKIERNRNNASYKISTFLRMIPYRKHYKLIHKNIRIIQNFVQNKLYESKLIQENREKAKNKIVGFFRRMRIERYKRVIILHCRELIRHKKQLQEQERLKKEEIERQERLRREEIERQERLKKEELQRQKLEEERLKHERYVLEIQRQKEEMERKQMEELELRDYELEKQRILMEEQKLEQERKLMSLEDNFSRMAGSFNKIIEKEERQKRIIDHLDNERQELLLAIAKKDLSTLEKLDNLEKQILYLQNANMENNKNKKENCVIM
jgi:myosin-5